MKLLKIFQLVKSVNSTKNTEKRKVELSNEIKTLSKDLLERAKEYEPKENLNDFEEKIKAKSKENIEYFRKFYNDRIYTEKNKVELMEKIAELYDKETKLIYEISEEFKVPINLDEYKVLNREDCLNEMKKKIDNYCEFKNDKETYETYKKRGETLQIAYDFLTCLNEKIKTDKGERIKSLETETITFNRVYYSIRLLKEFEKEKLDKEDAEKLEELLQKLKKIKYCFGLYFLYQGLECYPDHLIRGFNLVQILLISKAGNYIRMKQLFEARLTTILKADTSCLRSQKFLNSDLYSISQYLKGCLYKEFFGETGQKLKKTIDELRALSEEKHTSFFEGSNIILIVGLGIFVFVLVVWVPFYFIIIKRD